MIYTNYKPILFSTPMVQAILDGSKLQTRREIKSSSTEMTAIMINVLAGCEVDKNNEYLFNHARIKKGDILWVREKFCFAPLSAETKPFYPELSDFIHYETTTNPKYIKWKPSIHMPKEAARIFLRVKNVRMELLQEITAKDAIKEGIKGFIAGYKNYMWNPNEHHIDYENSVFRDPIISFKSLWQSINGLDSWDLNPMVWVIEFEQIDKPNDFPNA